MPNPFSSNASREQRKPEPEVEELEALFECYTCYEGVRKALYNSKTCVLTWVCSKGHNNEERDIRIV